MNKKEYKTSILNQVKYKYSKILHMYSNEVQLLVFFTSEIHRFTSCTVPVIWKVSVSAPGWWNKLPLGLGVFKMAKDLTFSKVLGLAL